MLINIPHNLPDNIAKARISGLLDRVKSNYSDTISNLTETWNGNENRFSFTAKGFKISGRMQLKESLVALDLKLPLAALIMKGKIKSIIENEAKRVLA